MLASSTTTTRLSLTEVLWLLIGLADATSTGCMPMTKEPVWTANSPLVARFKFKWDFDDLWKAVILDGPYKGELIEAVVSKFTEDMWTMVDAMHAY